MSFNYKNVKFAVDHLTFKKVINSILEILTTIKNKITNLSDSIGEQIFSNNVLVLDESNWDQYITPRPKIVGLAGDGEHDASIANNPLNQESCFYVAIERDTYKAKDDFLKNLSTSQTSDIDYFNNVLKNDNIADSSNSGLDYFIPYKAVTDVSIINDAVKKFKFVKITKARLTVPKKYNTILFNFRYISFIGLSIVPEGFVENLEDTDDETNQNKKLNGTEINIFQSATSGIDISSFRSLGDKTSGGNNLTIKERVVSLINEKGKIGVYKANATTTKRNDESSYLDNSVPYEKVENALYLDKTTKCTILNTIDEIDTYPTYFLEVPFWGGIMADSVNSYYSYNKYEYPSGSTIKYNNLSFDNLLSLSYTSFSSSSFRIESDTPTIRQEELSGTYIDESFNTSTGTTKRLRPGRETKLIWYNGFWFYC